MTSEIPIKDVLHNCDDRSGASDDYCKGIIVASVAVLMGAKGYSFDNALLIVRRLMPTHTRENLFPESWGQS